MHRKTSAQKRNLTQIANYLSYYTYEHKIFAIVFIFIISCSRTYKQDIPVLFLQ